MGMKRVLIGDLANKVAETFGLPKEKSREIVTFALAEIRASVASGEEVSLHKFGSLYARPTNARTGRNPQTGEPVEIPAGRRVAFKASDSFLEG